MVHRNRFNQKLPNHTKQTKPFPCVGRRLLRPRHHRQSGCSIRARRSLHITKMDSIRMTYTAVGRRDSDCFYCESTKPFGHRARNGYMITSGMWWTIGRINGVLLMWKRWVPGDTSNPIELECPKNWEML